MRARNTAADPITDVAVTCCSDLDDLIDGLMMPRRMLCPYGKVRARVGVRISM